MIEISALKEPAHPAINNSDNVAAIHSFKVVKATGKNKKSTASECIMAQYKKKGTYDYKLLNNHTRKKMKTLFFLTCALVALLLLVIGLIAITHNWGDRTPDGKKWIEKDDRDTSKLIWFSIIFVVIFVVGTILLFPVLTKYL